MKEQNYNELSDEEVIVLIRGGDGQAVEFLLGKYKNLVRKKANTLFLFGGEREDLYQEGMIGLYKAIRDYQMDKEASFLTFADLCISRQIYTAMQSSNTKKNRPLNHYISIDSSSYGEHMEEQNATRMLIETLVHTRNINPEELLIDQENKKQLELALYAQLSKLEREILTKYLMDYDYETIAIQLHRDKKAVDNALQRIRKKLSQIVKNMNS